jgi:tetratricopeptide (TPR) repeat protein
MSLLMKALEKAVQDRNKNEPGTSSQPTEKVAGKPAGSELALEAVELKPGIKADENNSRVTISPKRAASAPLNPTSRTSATPLAGKDNPRSADQAHAATVLSAQQQAPSAAAAALNWLRARPVYVIGSLAAVFLLLYGGYVYVQIAHPGLLRKTPPPAIAVAPAAPPAVAPGPPLAPAAPISGGSALGEGANSPFVSMQSVIGGRSDIPSPPATPGAASSTGAVGAASASKEFSGTVAPSAPPPPTRAAAAAPTAPPSETPPTAAPASRVAVSRGDSAVARVNATVSEAYNALQARDYEAAQRLYSQVLRSEPANVDALLGMASIAQQENRNDDAQRYFLAILDVEPRNTLAQSGLVAMMSRADPQAAESRLKQLLTREPSPPLFFTLGNLYADLGQWPQAQQAYFQAYSLEPRNPEYAYNLAVGLEHLGQQKLALEFYRKAAQLASIKGSANFDMARIQERITQLAARLE